VDTVDVALEENYADHEHWCNDIAAKLLCVLVLDRFGDFVSDQVNLFHLIPMYQCLLTSSQVVAPVRETVSQTLASLLLHMPRRSVFHVHTILLQMIRQDFFVPTNGKKGKGHGHIWEVRHAGLLGIKYEVAVRSDLFTETPVKEDIDEVDSTGREVLRGVVDAAVLG
jgi:TATA-binding protein-associated factor